MTEANLNTRVDKCYQDLLNEASAYSIVGRAMDDMRKKKETEAREKAERMKRSNTAYESMAFFLNDLYQLEADALAVFDSGASINTSMEGEVNEVVSTTVNVPCIFSSITVTQFKSGAVSVYYDATMDIDGHTIDYVDVIDSSGIALLPTSEVERRVAKFFIEIMEMVAKDLQEGRIQCHTQNMQ